MVEISRDGKRVYLTNSLYRTWDEQFYPDGIKGWLAKIDVQPERRHRARSRRVRASSTACVRTRCTSRAATPARIPTASREVRDDERDDDVWTMLMALGAFHGINPGMGWLFAVALGMQERRRGAVLWALVPLGAGHALAVAVAAGAALAIGGVIPIGWLRWLYRRRARFARRPAVLRHRHPRWAGMRVGIGGLTLWSFLMATAHGAGLMVVPVFAGHVDGGRGRTSAPHAADHRAGAEAALFAAGLHAVGYLVVTASIAILVFEKLGVGILRRAWFNLDLIWAGALVATGLTTLLV